jgi:hypothetical protein
VSLKPGTRLFAQNSSCQVVVVRSAAAVDTVLCAGLEMLPADAASGATVGTTGGATAGGPAIELGKRYVDDGDTVEILCTKPGVGPLTLAGQELSIKAAKPLPASD